MKVKFPEVEVTLVGEDGNSFLIIGRITKALRRSGATKEEVDQFKEESMSGDYDNLLQTCMRWVNVN